MTVSPRGIKVADMLGVRMQRCCVFAFNHRNVRADDARYQMPGVLKMLTCWMSLARFGCHALLAAGLAAVVVPAATRAQGTDWPQRTVTVVVPFAAGGNTDIMARLASQKLSDTFKQAFVVENRVGAGGAIAADYVVQQ